MAIENIDSPIEKQHTGKGNPKIIANFPGKLNNRQLKLLEMMPEFNSIITVPKKSVNMADLSALTAETGMEYAMFTLGTKRLVIRGNENSVKVSSEQAAELAKQGYRWSGHTHPGYTEFVLVPSKGDTVILSEFEQPLSAIYNSFGEQKPFNNILRRKKHENNKLSFRP